MMVFFFFFLLMDCTGMRWGTMRQCKIYGSLADKNFRKGRMRAERRKGKITPTSLLKDWREQNLFLLSSQTLFKTVDVRLVLTSWTV